MHLRILTSAFVAVLALAALAPSAQAGKYHLYSCRTPAGESAPTDGWSGSLAAGGAFDDYVRDTCAEGGALIAALGDQTTHAANVDMATWEFSVPGGESLANATLWRAGYLHGRANDHTTYQFWLAGPNKTSVFLECIYTLACSGQGEPGQPLSMANRVDVPSLNLGAQLSTSVSCFAGLPGYECQNGFGDANGYAAVVYLYAADLVLEQDAGPTAGNVSGELASAPAVRGTSDIAFSAADAGAGVYEAVFSVDGQVVQSTVVNENGGRCKNVGQTTDGLAAFLYVKPCLASVSADVGFDTTTASNGTHHLIVSVTDAAGNAAPVLDRNVTIDNPGVPGPPNGVNASEQPTLTANWKGTSKERLTSSYGRAQTLVGRLTGSGGVPIEGALIDLTAKPSYLGARAAPMGGSRTGPDGRFSVRLPGGISSRTVRVAYRSHLGDELPVATRTLTLSVHAGLALSVAPHTASVGRSIFFRGRLLGGPIPAGGKQLVLEARSPGGPWIEFRVIRTDAHGRFRASYRFKFSGPADYQFRALSEAESDFPFVAGASNLVRVREQ